MKVVVDTNVFVSGVFFSGPPYDVLNAWRRGRVHLVVSSEILDEYRATGDALSASFPDVNLSPWLDLISAKALFIEAPPLPHPVCTDPDDDVFIACAIAGRVRLIISGDKALQRVSGYKGISVLSPRQFKEEYLQQ
jgi:putative PIN family toxin of toxin-antitoxin system